MATYIATASYSSDSFKGMVAKPQDREAAARTLFEAVGIQLHQCYFSVSDGDIVVVVEGTAQQMAAMEMAVMASGAFTAMAAREVITMAEMTAAMESASKVMPAYTPPNR